MDFDAVALEGIKPDYIMMSDLTQHNGQHEITFKLAVKKVEIAEEKAGHDDRN
jgi:hypothetical protein